ncbi:MAG: AAA family ATPase, partial [Rhodoferax sp.]|nr:AAA family ATPase [Rhodoferax sp.]
VYLANPSFSRHEILAVIGRDLGLADLPVATEARLAALHAELLRRHACGQRVLLVIDEAHAMPPESLEEVRLLSNLETGQHKLINIMLFGQPELEEVLADRRLRQVRDRVVHRFALSPLPPQDAAAYIEHRLRAAGWSGGVLFEPAALKMLIGAAGGRARRINLLADKALLASYAQGLQCVTVRQVKDAISELHSDFSSRARWLPVWWPWAACIAALSVLMTGSGFWLWEQQRTVVRVPVAAALSVPSAPAAPVVAPEPPAKAATAPDEPSVSPLAASPLAEVRSDPQTQEPDTLERYLQRTHAVLADPKLGGYAVQLASLPRDNKAVRYLNFVSHEIKGSEVYAQLTQYNGRSFVSVFVGRFDTGALANSALADWPASVKTNRPILRTWVRIKEDQSL